MAEPYRFRRRMTPKDHPRSAPAPFDPGIPANGGGDGGGDDEAAREAEALAAILAGDATDDVALRRVVEALAELRPAWGWVGVYLLAGDTLVLGPYAGPATEHTRIPVGKGVCGTAVAEDRNVVVEDVTTLDNYLACSVGTRSEIVVLIRDGGELVGQFDVDSDEVGAFGPEDEALLERLARLAGPRCRRLAARLAQPES
jgi:GAF domain-containing protein